MNTHPTRAQLDSDLSRLEAAVPAICRDYPDELQLEAIATEGELIRESAAPEDDEYVSARVEAMLINAGLIEGEPANEQPKV